MLRKPWPIILLAVFFFLSPIGNILVTYLLLSEKTTFLNYMISLFEFQENYFYLFNMIVPDFIAGIAVLAVRRWSYPVVLTCIVWLSANSLYNGNAELTTFYVFVGILFPMVFNFSVVSYFLLPSIKTTYFEPRVKWWETKPRYSVDIKTKLISESKTTEGRITNISEGGAYIKANEELDKSEKYRIEFDLHNIKVDFEFQIVFNSEGTSSYGLEFGNLSKLQMADVKSLMKAIKNSGAEPYRSAGPWKEDFKQWISSFLKTGKGLTPKEDIDRILKK